MIWLFTFLISTAYAATPLWTFTPIGSTSGGACIGSVGHQNVSYTVTNQSRKTHTLAYQAIPGVVQNTSAGNCSNPFVLGYQKSCVLNLDFYGSQIQGNVRGGPVVCEQNGPGLQCYQPSAASQLNVQIATSVIIPSTGGNGSISPSTPVTISCGGSQTFTATPNSGYGVSQWFLDNSSSSRH